VHTPPVRSVPCHVARSRARWCSRTHHNASQKPLQFIADVPSGANGTPEHRPKRNGNWRPPTVAGHLNESRKRREEYE